MTQQVHPGNSRATALDLQTELNRLAAESPFGSLENVWLQANGKVILLPLTLAIISCNIEVPEGTEALELDCQGHELWIAHVLLASQGRVAPVLRVRHASRLRLQSSSTIVYGPADASSGGPLPDYSGSVPDGPSSLEFVGRHPWGTISRG